MRNWLARCGLAGALLAASACAPLEKALVFHPRPYPQGDWEAAGLQREDAWFQAADGPRLHGWFAEVAQPNAIVLYCHGNAGNVASLDWVVAFFTERLNCSVLVFDYRGYGRSEGQPSDTGILADARAARKWLAQRTGVAETDIVLVGHSLGGAVAIDLAAKDGARGLVVQSAFSTLADMGDVVLSPLPARWFMTMQLDSVANIQKYRGPLLQSHGDADRLIPYRMGKRLFEAANEPKMFVTIPGGGHNDLPDNDYIPVLDSFLANLPRPTPAVPNAGQ